MTSLRDVVLAGLQTRFCAAFADDQYHVVSILIPRSKVNYLPEDEQHTKKLLLVVAVQSCIKIRVLPISMTTNQFHSPRLPQVMIRFILSNTMLVLKLLNVGSRN